MICPICGKLFETDDQTLECACLTTTLLEHVMLPLDMEHPTYIILNEVMRRVIEEDMA